MSSKTLPKINEKEGSSVEHLEFVESKKTIDVNSIEKTDSLSSTLSSEENLHQTKPPTTAKDLVTEILLVEDDPTQNPWTFRTWFIGIGLSMLSSSITAINVFKPQPVQLHTVFIVVLSYVLGFVLHRILPSKGIIGQLFNPGPFNKKEHSAIVIMTAAAGSTPEAMTVLAVQKLWYNINPSPLIGIFVVLSTQMLGYGMAGLLRKTLVYPAKMLYPMSLPTASLLENFHRDRGVTRKRMKIFWIGLIVMFCWHVFPAYIMPLLAGISIFCLTHQNSLLVTNLFGGSMANEGLGFLSISLDWNMLTSGGNPLWMPFQTITNSLIGYLLAIPCFMLIYYGNTWGARSFPFLSPLMFASDSTPKKYVSYNQTSIMDHNYSVQESLLHAQGLPNLAATHVLGMIVRNVGITATVAHMILWHWDDIKSAFEFLNPKGLKKLGKPSQWDLRFWKHRGVKMSDEEAEEICPHYRLMQAYDEVPSSWFAALWILAASVGLVTTTLAQSTLPWWTFFLAVIISGVCLTFFASLTAMFGFNLMVQPLIQMIGALIIPGKPLANMYFATFGYNSLYQAKLMLRDLKLGQYVHLAPKCTFIMQIAGTTIGCCCSYLMMEKITTEKRDILLAIQGTNVWSGQTLQGQNSAAVSWGGLAKYMYVAGARYQWVSLSFLLGLFVPLPFWLIHKYVSPKLRLDYFNTAIIASAMGVLEHGTHSALLGHYIIGFFSQFYLRKYRTNWFIKYNYILSAGMDGGVALISFILTFTVFGAAGKTVPFPKYWGNNWERGNYDYCMRDPGIGKKRH